MQQAYLTILESVPGIMWSALLTNRPGVRSAAGCRRYAVSALRNCSIEALEHKWFSNLALNNMRAVLWVLP